MAISSTSTAIKHASLTAECDDYCDLHVTHDNNNPTMTLWNASV
jgi:hypothetical protein